MMMNTSGLQITHAKLLCWLKHIPTKILAREINADPRTIESWRQGYTTPTFKHLCALAWLWGDAFILDVFSHRRNDIGTLERVGHIEVQLQLLKQKLHEESKQHVEKSKN